MGFKTLPPEERKTGWVSDTDPGPSATDRGSGEEFPACAEARAQAEEALTPAEVEDTVERIKLYPERPWAIPAEAIGEKLIATLEPEVLAQLKRIEDMLKKLEASAHRCPDCGAPDCPWEEKGLPG